MHTFLAKLFTSSQDPTKISLMVKGLLMAMAPILMVVFGLTEADFNGIVDALVKLVFVATSLVAAIQVAYGAIRKVRLGRWTHTDAG